MEVPHGGRLKNGSRLVKGKISAKLPQTVKAESTKTKLKDFGEQMAKNKKKKSTEFFGFHINIYLNNLGKKVAVAEIGEYKIVKEEGQPAGQTMIWKGQEYCGEFYSLEELKAFFKEEYNISTPEALKVDSFLKLLR
jgi:hypothetical protein